MDCRTAVFDLPDIVLNATSNTRVLIKVRAAPDHINDINTRLTYLN